MNVSKFMNNHLGLLKRDIINKMPNTSFDSHEFIRAFAKAYEADYVGFLGEYEVEAFRNVNEQIAKFLLENQEALGIKYDGEQLSVNVFGERTKNEKWMKM